MKNKKGVFFTVLSRILFFLVIGIFLYAEVCAAKEKEKKVKWVKSKTGISSLMTLSKDRGAMEADYKKETKNYEAVREAIDKGALTKGMSGDEVSKKYGDAIMILSEADGGKTRWVYKLAAVNYFSGSKVYLFFNSTGELESWETVDPKETSNSDRSSP